MGKKSKTKKLARELAKEKEEKELRKKKPFKKKTKKDIKKEAQEEAAKKIKKKETAPKKTAKPSSKKTTEKKKKDTKATPKTQQKKTAKTAKSTKKSTKTKAKKEARAQKILKSIKENKKRIFSAVFALIMLAVLIFVGILLFQKAFRAQPIAKFLPAQYTVATLEINSNLSHHQISKTFNLLKEHPDYSKESLMEDLEKRTGLNYKEDLSLWLGRSMGMAVLNFGEDGGVNTVYFTEFISSSNLKDFLGKKRAEKDEYNGYTTYEYGGEYHMAVIADYLFIAEDSHTVEKIIDSRVERLPTLYGTSQYRRIDNNLPIGKLAFAYINYEAINDEFFQHFPFLSEKGLSMATVKPLVESFKAEGIALMAMDNNFAIQSFLSLSDKMVDQTATYISEQKKYRAELLEYVSPDVILFWGGENLETQMQRLIRVFSGGNTAYVSAFNTILENYVEKYLGRDTSFEKDILPVIKNEFLFVVEEIEEEIAYKFISDLQNDQSAAVKIHEIAEKFAELGAVFEPRVVENILPDGTVGREIVAIPRQIEKEEHTYGTHKIFELKMGEENESLYYAISGGIAFITNNEESIKTSLDLFDGEEGSMRNSVIFEKQIEPIVRSSDEVSYFRTDRLIPIFLSEYELPEFTEIILSLSSGRNYFHDGIVTINYLHIK